MKTDLSNIVGFKCNAEGVAETGQVLHVKQLIEIAAIKRCMMFQCLKGAEISALRKISKLQSRSTCTKIELAAKDLSKVENDTQILSFLQEKVFRMLIVEQIDAALANEMNAPYEIANALAFYEEEPIAVEMQFDGERWV